MRIENATHAGGGPEGGAFVSQAAQTRDEFLRLFVAQLNHQDPLEPQKGSEFVAQLAQFAQLEQMANVNSRLELIEAQQATTTGAAMASMVGKTATTNAQHVHVTGTAEGPPPLMVDLRDRAEKVTVVVRDASGTEVRRLDLGPLPVGVHPAGWDGRLEDGTPLAAGDYTIEIKATSTSGGELPAKPVLKGTLDAVEFRDGGLWLRFGMFTVTPSEVMAIGL